MRHGRHWRQLLFGSKNDVDSGKCVNSFVKSILTYDGRDFGFQYDHSNKRRTETAGAEGGAEMNACKLTSCVIVCQLPFTNAEIVLNFELIHEKFKVYKWH
jgi:hypothetical protein